MGEDILVNLASSIQFFSLSLGGVTIGLLCCRLFFFCLNTIKILLSEKIMSDLCFD